MRVLVVRLSALALFLCILPANAHAEAPLWDRITATGGQTLASMRSSAGSPFTWVIISLFLVCAIYGLALMLKARTQASEIERILKRIAGISAVGKGTRDHARQIGELLSPLSELNEQWYEFMEGLVEYRDIAHNTHQVGEFVTDDAFLYSIKRWHLRWPMAASVPSTFTGLGLLGTFLGIAVGLGSLADTSDATNQINLVIPQLASAFWTSIAGVCLSIVFGLAQQYWEAKLLSTLHRFRDRVDRTFPRLTAEHLMVEGEDTQARQLEELGEVRGLMQTLATDVAQQLNTGYAESLQTHLVPHLKRVADVVSEQVAGAGTQSEEAARQFTEKLVSKLGDTLEESFAHMAESVSVVRESIGALNDSVALSLQSTQQATSSLGGFATEGGALLQSLHQAAELSAREIKDVFAVQASLGDMSAKFESMLASLAGATGQQQQFADNTAQTQASITEQMQLSATAYGQGVQELQTALPAITRAMAELGNRVTAMDGVTEAVANSATSVSTSFERSLSMMESRLQREEELFTQYDQVAIQFKSALKEASPMFGQLALLATALDAQRRGMDGISTQLERSHAGLHEIATNLDKGISVTRESIQGAAVGMRDAVEATKGWGAAAESALGKFADGVKESVEGSLTQYDRSLTDSVNSLARAMRQVEDVAEEIADNSESRRSQPSAS